MRQSLSNMVSYLCLLRPLLAHRLDFELQIAVQKEWCAVPMLVTKRLDDPVSGAAVVPGGPFVHRVAHVDDVGVFFDGHGDPGLGWGVEDFEAFGARLLEEDGDAAEVGVVADCRLCMLGENSLKERKRHG